MIERGEITPVKQDESLSSHVKMMDKSMGKIDWTQDAVCIERLVRGLDPWPSAFTFCGGRSVKIWSSDVLAGDMAEQTQAAAQPGTIVAVAKDHFDVACGSGILRVYELQLEGKAHGCKELPAWQPVEGRNAFGVSIARKGECCYAVFLWVSF